MNLDVPSDMQPLLSWLGASERPLRGIALTALFPAIPWAQIKTLLHVLIRTGYLKLLRHVPLRADDCES